jgi:hypothetical protein
MNAGEQISVVAEEVATLSKICPRCLQPAERIINDSLCISCYNRAREAQLGRNAKGGTPQLCARLHDIDMAVLADGELRVTTTHRTVGAAEAMIGVARHAQTALAFGWVASGPGNQEAGYVE